MLSIRASAAQSVLGCLLCSALLVPAGAWAQTITVPPDGYAAGFARAPGLFPGVWHPYIEQSVDTPALDNSERLGKLIHGGELRLSLSDALALTLENNLDIVVQRYVIYFSQTDILRTKSGQAARGFTGAFMPGELNSGAIGAGVSSSGGTGGTGNAGGITGGGGAVNVGPAGAFDPTVSLGFSWDRVTSPLNSVVVSGIPTTTSYATSLSGTYAQAFTNGASYSVSLSGLRQSTTQHNTLYNPDVTTRLSIGFNQPLLAGSGKLPNERFMMVARNNRTTAREVFRLQVINSVAQLEDAYWDLAAAQENVRVATESVTVASDLLRDSRKQYEIGTMSGIDVVTAESQEAAAERDLIIARTALEQQTTTLKQLISKRNDPALDAATIVIVDPEPEPLSTDLPTLQAALDTADANRPELEQARVSLQNQEIALRFTRNNMLPSTAVFGLYASSGLQGNTTLVTAGAGGSLAQSFGASYPEAAYGLSTTAVIRNRSAQADSLRAQLERNQLEVTGQNTRNQIGVQVRQARVNLVQGKAQVEAAHEAVRLARLTLDAERKKLELGLSTTYNVILRDRDLVSAQYAEVQSVTTYANSLVAMDQATGTILDRHRIELIDAMQGSVSQPPAARFQPPAPEQKNR
jgi:outer membrane protein TolC